MSEETPNSQRVAILIAETPLLTRARERSSRKVLRLTRDSTGSLPVIPGSSIAGAVKRAARQANQEAGEPAFSDAELLLFPLRSLSGPVLWVTSTQKLDSFFGGTLEGSWEEGALVSSAEKLLDSKVSLEEYFFPAVASAKLAAAGAKIAGYLPAAAEYEWLRTNLPSSLATVEEDLLSALIKQNTVFSPHLPAVDGAATPDGFIFREYAPTDAIFFAQVREGSVQGSMRVQIGSDETRGRGICAIAFGER